MKSKATTAAAALALGATMLMAQDSFKNLRPVYPGGAVPTNHISTNASTRTNAVGIGAPGRNGGVDSGEQKGGSVGEAPPVGTPPGPGQAPSVGTAPPIRNITR